MVLPTNIIIIYYYYSLLFRISILSVCSDKTSKDR